MKTDEKRRKSEEGSLESFPLQRRQNIGPLSSALQKALITQCNPVHTNLFDSIWMVHNCKLLCEVVQMFVPQSLTQQTL